MSTSPTPDDLEKSLRKVDGIGPKTAKRIAEQSGVPIIVPTPYAVRTAAVDERGRFALGVQFANRNVAVAILEPHVATITEWPYDPLSHMQANEVVQDDTDDRGRIKIGPEYAGDELTVAVIQVGERVDG